MPNLSQPRAFVRCRDCHAWVDRRAEQCPLCGIAWPTSRWLTLRQESGLSWRDLAAGVGALTGLLSGLSLWQFWQHAIRYGTPGPLRFTVLVGATAIAYALGRAFSTPRRAFFLACGALALSMPVVLHTQMLLTFPDGLIGSALVLALGLFGWFAGRIFGPSIAAEHWERRQAHNVVTMLAMLERRLVELRQSREKMVALGLRLAQQLPGAAQHPALVTLRTAIHATDAQYHSHVVHGWQFTTAIWQNQAQPILAQWRHFNAPEAEAAVATLDALSHDGEQLVQAWQDAPEAADPRGQRAIVQQQRLLAAVGQLRQAVLLRQATALAEATPGIHEAFDTGTLPGAALTEIDELRQGVRFLDLTASAAELLAENERLSAEQAAIREVEKLVS